MSQYHKAFFFFPLLLWNVLTCIEIYGYIHKEHSPVYWRAWEYVTNYIGKDAGFAPFKPLSKYSGMREGDLFNAIEFTPHADEVKKQDFIVDEYGYRNRPGFLDQKADAVVVGSSFVAGGAETQDHLISEILTRDYGIRTYNYSTSVQYFWDDPRFIQETPHYVFAVGAEGELIQSLWKYSIVDKPPYNQVKKWQSYEQWKAMNESFPDTFEKIGLDLKNYSLIRHYSIQIRLKIKNTIYSRDEIAQQTTQNFVTYDPETQMLFWQKEYDNPFLGSPGKKKQDIQAAVSAYSLTKKKLEKRGVRIIFIALPSKTHLELKKYSEIPDKDQALAAFNEELKKANIEYIDLSKIPFEIQKKEKKPLYYTDDSHWNSEMNYLISHEIAQYLKNK